MSNAQLDRMIAQLDRMIAEQKEASFEEPASASDAEALGILISNYFEWDCVRIMETFVAALEDSNFHSAAAKVDEMLDELRAS